MNFEAERLAEMGYAKFLVGRFAESEECLQAALQLDPQDPDKYRVHAHILFKLRRFDEAAAEMDRALQYVAHASDAAQVYSDAAALFLELRRLPKAQEIIETAEKLGLAHRHFAEMKREIADLLSDKGDELDSDSPYDQRR